MEPFTIGHAHLHYGVTMVDRVSGRAVNSRTGVSFRIRRVLPVLPEVPVPDVVPAVTARQGASAEARVRLRDHGPAETMKVSLSSDEETSAQEEVDELMDAAPAASQSVAAASSSQQEVSCNAAGQLLGGTIAAAAPASARKRDDPPVPWTYQHPPTEPICDQAARLSLSKQVLFPNVDGEFRQKWLEEAGTIEFRRLYSRSDIHIIQTFVSGDFGVPLSEEFYAVLWPYIRARDLGNYSVRIFLGA